MTGGITEALHTGLGGSDWEGPAALVPRWCLLEFAEVQKVDGHVESVEWRWRGKP